MLRIARHRNVLLYLTLLLAVIFLSGCSSMEEKRDKFLAHGKELYQQGDYIRARLEFKNALQIDPKWAEGHLWLGKTEVKLNNFRGAYGSLSQAVELKPTLTEGQILLGQIMLLARRLDDAEAKSKLALEQEPKNPEALLLAASVALAREQTQKALDLLAELRKVDPSLPTAYLMQSTIESNQKQPAVAAATLEAGLKANPKAISLYIARARLADSQKQFDVGEATLLKAIELEPKNPNLQAELARHYGLAGQLDKAEQALRRNLTLEPQKETHAVELARFFVNQGRSKEAEQALKDFISQNPQNFPARFALADFYLNTGREGKAEKALKDIITQDPSGPKGVQAKNRLARLRLSRGHLDAAGKLVDEVLKDNPKDMGATMNQGLIALAKKDGLKAVNSFRIITQDQPQDPEAWLLLARAHALNKEPELAKDKAKKALELKGDYLEARTFLYGLYLEAKDYDGAIQTIKNYLKFNDRDIFNLNALGDAYAQKGDLGQARATFQKIVSLEPKNPLGYYKQGLLSRGQKQPDAALKFFETALAQQPNFLPALQQIVAVNLDQKRPEKALEAVRQAVARNPKNPQFHQMLGELLLAQKQPQAAVAALEEALALNPSQTGLRLLAYAYQQLPDQEAVSRRIEERVTDPKTPPFYFLILAMIYEQQQKFDKALDVYNALLARNLFPVIARNNLSYLLADRFPTPENLDRALRLTSETLEEFPDDANLLDTMGWILCRQGNFAKAKTYLEQSVAQFPNHPTSLYHLGWCQARLGETEKARETLKKALDLKTGFPELAATEQLLASLSSGSKP